MAKVTQNSHYLLVSEAASLLEVSSDTLRRWHKKGLIRAVRDPEGNRRFSAEEILRLKNRNADTGQAWKILKAPMSKLTHVEFFVGAGGLALGLEHAGFRTSLVVDNDKDSIATIRQNRPGWAPVCKSVSSISLKELQGTVDVVSGGFPCQAFSYAGHKNGFADTRGTLFYDFARLINEIQPKIALAENVRGLVNHDSGRTLRVMLNELSRIGYRAVFKVLRAQFLDVPQKRERLFIVAIRNDLDLKPLFPKEKDYTLSLQAALADVPDSPGQSYSPRKASVMAQVPEGGYWRDLPDAEQRRYMGRSYYLGGGKTGMARRLAWNEPSLTLTCNPAQKQTERCHPTETRPLTTREYARVQTFPDDWLFAGSISSQYRQIGNAVPVNLGYHMGLALRQTLGSRPKHADDPASLELGQLEQET